MKSEYIPIIQALKRNSKRHKEMWPRCPFLVAPVVAPLGLMSGSDRILENDSPVAATRDDRKNVSALFFMRHHGFLDQGFVGNDERGSGASFSRRRCPVKSI